MFIYRAFKDALRAIKNTPSEFVSPEQLKTRFLEGKVPSGISSNCVIMDKIYLDYHAKFLPLYYLSTRENPSFLLQNIQRNVLPLLYHLSTSENPSFSLQGNELDKTAEKLRNNATRYFRAREDILTRWYSDAFTWIPTKEMITWIAYRKDIGYRSYTEKRPFP